MQVLRIPVGQLSTNCYLLYDQPGGEGVVIDPGAEAFTIINALEKRRLSLGKILLTHGHADHLGAASKLQEKYGSKILIHSADSEMAGDFERNLSTFIGLGKVMISPDQLLQDGDLFRVVDDHEVVVIHTPGHSPGSCCFHLPAQKILFSGDTLFAGGFGRTDLAGGDAEELRASLGKILPVLPPETLVYPGHGAKTTLEEEKSLIGLLDKA